MQIVKIDKRALTNAQHYAFIVSFISLFQQSSFTYKKFDDLFSSLSDIFKEEEKGIQISHHSIWTKKIQEGDAGRQKNYQWLKRLVYLWSETEIEPQKSAADALKKVIIRYNINPKAQLDEETGLINHFIDDIKSSKILFTALSTLHIEKFFLSMEVFNNQVRDSLVERARESATKWSIPLRSARLEVDKIYNMLCELIESLSIIRTDAEPYISFAIKWNNIVLRYKDMLKKKYNKKATIYNDVK